MQSNHPQTFSRSQRIAWWVCLLLLALGALALRAPQLGERAMHVDEAVQAWKAGDLFEGRGYTFDPFEYHGPTLYYFVQPLLHLSGAKSFADSNEITYRLIPLAFGVGLFFLLPLVAPGLGRGAALCAGVLLAVSPAFAFFSRFFIQEMILVFFSFALIGCGWRWWRCPCMGWAVASGLCVGLMHATKETSVLNFMALALALLGLGLWFEHRNAPRVHHLHFPPRQMAVALLSAAAISMLFYSSFFANPEGILDSVRTYWYYLMRAGGEGSRAVHRHPWYYYFALLGWFRLGLGPYWSEGLILALALVGIIAAFARRLPFGDAAFLRFLALYASLLMLMYSAIPYKSPWTILSAYLAVILMAGAGAAYLITMPRDIAVRIMIVIPLLVGCVHLGRNAWLAETRYATDVRNPYVYAHALTDVRRLGERIEQLAALAPEGTATRVNVIASDYWPLPWYLRRLSGVGYWYAPVEGTEALDAPLIVTSPDVEPHLIPRLREQYETQFYGLRPEVFLQLYVRKDLWDTFIAAQSAPAPPAP